MKKLIKYFRIWWLMSRNSFMNVLFQRMAFMIFLVGKVLRFLMFFGFLFFLLKGTKNLAGYNLNQTIFFFLTFNFVDVVAQFLFREVYRFRPLVVNGGFDLVLTKPMSALFRVLMGGADVVDLATIPPLIFAIYWVGNLFHPTPLQLVLFLFLLFNGLLIATAFHIAVLGLGIITLEIDHSIMIYRDLSSLGRLPIDIYKEPLKSVLTFLVPVGIMVTLPAKALMGLVSPLGALASSLIGILGIILAVRFWKFALTKYASASS